MFISSVLLRNRSFSFGRGSLKAELLSHQILDSTDSSLLKPRTAYEAADQLMPPAPARPLNADHPAGPLQGAESPAWGSRHPRDSAAPSFARGLEAP